MPATLVLHGGAGTWPADGRPAAAEAMERCADAGWKAIDQGALAAVVAAVQALEDEPLFNAGIGACLNGAGRIQHDAGVMEGTDLRAGAVGAVLGPRHPIDLALAVMERSENVLLVGPEAVEFGRGAGVEMADPALFLTEKRRAEVLTSDTVGAVAVDAAGHTAAAVSTGGYTGKRPGRLGDTPIPGAGFYADDAAGAVASTGTGEGFIRLVLARRVRDSLGAGVGPRAAIEAALTELSQRTGMLGGIIAVTRDGEVGWHHNTEHMPVAVRQAQ